MWMPALTVFLLGLLAFAMYGVFSIGQQFLGTYLMNQIKNLFRKNKEEVKV